MEASKPRSYYGLLTSLYSSVEPGHVDYLERAIWANRIGKYNDAIAIFKDHLDPVLDVPVILIELANLYYSNFRYHDLCNLLEPKIERVRKSDPAQLDKPEWRLIALLYSVGANRCRGWMEPGIRELKRTKEWLSKVPVSEYTELHVQCAWRYVIAYLMTRLQTGVDGDINEYERIPRPTEPSSTVPWAGLNDLRKHLVKQGRFKEANAIFRPELNRAPLKQRLTIGEAFLKDLDGCDDLIHKNHMIASVRLQLAKAMVEIHELDLAKAQLDLCNAALSQWCRDVDIDDKVVLPPHLEIEAVRLGFISDFEERVRAAVDLADRMRSYCHSDYSRTLDTAAETAYKAAELTGNMKYRTQSLEIRECLEKVNEDINGDIIDLAIQTYQVHSLAQHTNVDAQKAIEWIDGFFEKYPAFKAPRTMESLWARKAVLLQTLRDLEGAKVAANEALKWDTLSGDLVRVNNMNRANIIAPGDGALGDAPYDSEDDIDDGSGFLDGWRTGYIGPQRMPVITIKMIDFALEDLKTERLSTADVRMMFDLSEGTYDEATEPQGQKTAKDTAEELVSLKEKNQEELFQSLWLPGSESDTSFEARYKFAQEWLKKPVKGSRDRRLMCLIRLLDVRASETKVRKLSIEDNENLLSIWETLPRMLKEFTASERWSWHASIAWNWFSLFLNGGTWTLFDNFSYLLEVDKRCDLAVEGFRKTNQLTAMANMQRLQAQLEVLLLRRLTIYKTISSKKERSDMEEKVLEASASMFGDIAEAEKLMPKVREDGLKLLTEVDQIFSATEREASWEEGFAGIEKRSNLNNMHMNHLTTQYAIRLWTDGTSELSKDAKVAIWNLTQKYKARLLSLAIGMYRPSPPSLVQRIEASSDEGPIYKQMIDLQRQIDDTDPKDRYFLRLRLDEHRKKMKDFPLLRQLIALREGTPLSLHDFEEIAKDSEDDVVLVDWFYLNPFFDRGKLLLLTARKGEVPTVDEVQIDVNAVEGWKQEHLNTSTWPRDGTIPKLGKPPTRKRFNDICSGIVKPLEKRTRQGEILVLCPTDFLAGLPIHALDVDEEALIRRNPCVYTHSHSLLRPCSSATQYACDTVSPLNPSFISGIAGVGKDAIDFAAGRKSVVDLSKQLGGACLIDQTATRNNFLEHAGRSRLLHVQTHCWWNSDNPLEHHIEFSIPEGISTICETLSAREIFGIQLQQGSHLNVIACSGALTDVKAGDEVMGLVPALLYSGASSVVSTLWPIRDPVGALFSRNFFDDFSEQQHTDAMRWVSVAKAVQEAVVALDPNQNKELLDWAAFVLYGYWMLAV